MKATENLFILSRQIELIYRNQKLGQIVSMAIAGYLAWVAQKEGVSATALAMWCTAAIGIALLRLFFARRYFQLSPAARSEQIHAWHQRARVGALASGLIWAAGSLMLMRSDNLPLQLFTAFAMAGITAGAIPVLGAAAGPRQLAQGPLDFPDDGVARYAQALQYRRDRPLLLLQQRAQQVEACNLGMSLRSRMIHRLRHGVLRFYRQFVQSHLVMLLSI